MKLRFLPQTQLGAWALGLAASWPVLAVLGSVIQKVFYAQAESGNGLIGDIRLRPWLAITVLFGIILGSTSFPLSLIAIIKKNERSVLSILAACMGLLLVWLLIGEFFFPH